MVKHCIDYVVLSCVDIYCVMLCHFVVRLVMLCYGLLSIESHHSVSKCFVIKTLSTNPDKPMKMFFIFFFL